jgi:SPP1 family predicted phage head-tail adaptor
VGGVIGYLDQRITLKTFTTTTGSIGDVVKTWANFATSPNVWARVTPLRGGEAQAEDRTVAVQQYRFTIRQRSDISEEDRITWRGDDYNIRRVERNGQRKQYLDVIAERGVGNEN